MTVTVAAGVRHRPLWPQRSAGFAGFAGFADFTTGPVPDWITGWDVAGMMQQPAPAAGPAMMDPWMEDVVSIRQILPAGA